MLNLGREGGQLKAIRRPPRTQKPRKGHNMNHTQKQTMRGLLPLLRKEEHWGKKILASSKSAKIGTGLESVA